MSDERCLFGKEEMKDEALHSKSGEALHVDLDIDGGLGLGLEGQLLFLKARAGDVKMDGEEKKSGFNKRTNSVEIKVDSDDDEPIGSLFKLKKHRNPKKAKSCLDEGTARKVEIRAENLMVNDEDSGEMDDTLASFRKKLKGPKVDRCDGSGTAKGNSSALKHDSSDFLLDGVLKDRPKGGGKRSRVAVMPKKMDDLSEFDDGLDQRSSVHRSRGTSMQEKKDGVLEIGGDCNYSLDENLEFSLSASVQKLQYGSIKKARSSSNRKQRRGTPASVDGLSRRSDGDSEDLMSKLIPGSHYGSKLSGEILKSEVRLNLASEQTPIDPAPVLEEIDFVLNGQMKDRAGFNPHSDLTHHGSLSSPAKVFACSPETTEEVVRSNVDGYDKHSEGIFGDSVTASALPRSSADSISDSREKSTIARDNEFDRQAQIPEEPTLNHDGLGRPWEEASEDFVSREVPVSCSASVQKLTEATQRFKNGFKQCSEGEGAKISENDNDGLNGLFIKVSENLLSIISSASAEPKPKLDSVCNEASDVQKTIAEVFSLKAAQESSFTSSAMPRKESSAPCFDDNQLNRPCEEKCQKNTLFCGDYLNQTYENTSKDLFAEKLSSVPCKSEADITNRNGGLVASFGICLEDSLTNTVPNSSPISIPVKMEEALKFKDGFDQFSDGCLKKFQLLPSDSALGSTKDDEIGSDFAGSPPIFLTSDIVKRSDFCSPMNQKDEPPANHDVSNHFSDELLPMDSITTVQELHTTCDHNKTSDDASKGISVSKQDPSSVKEVKETCSEPITLDPKETYSEDAEKTLDVESKDKKPPATNRAARKIKKRRHGDMAYEGDNDWEFLMHEQGIFENDRVVFNGDRPSRMKDKFDDTSYTVVEADNGGAAAVAAGLKARAAGPVEKIRFKEILRRRGGLQEYLECRNMILGLWSKDTSHILPLSDCGVNSAPSEGEPPRASLIREIYAFLDHNGYINIGIASEEKAEPCAKARCELYNVSTTEENCQAQAAEAGVTFLFGQVKSSENFTEVKNDVFFNDGKLISEATKSKKVVLPSTGSDLSTSIELEECTLDKEQGNGWIDTKLPTRMTNFDASSTNPSSKVVDCGLDSVLSPERTKDSYGIQSAVLDLVKGNGITQCDSKDQKRIIIIGAGPSGLTAARHLQRQGFSVTVLEARNRLGGRVHTDRLSLSVPVDLGASIITGVEADVATERRPDPSSLVCSQLGLELTVLNSDCPLYDIVSGEKVPADLDEALEAEYNSLLDDMVVLVAQKGEYAMRMSLEDGLEYALKRRCRARSLSDAEMSESDALAKVSLDEEIPNRTSSKEEILSPLERRVMDWHFANLEYGCAALLNAVSLPYWNQDDVYGGFGGAHCMIKGGYSAVIESLGKGLSIHLNHVVTEVSYNTRDSEETGKQQRKVKVSTSNGGNFVGDAVLITVPLGCLKADTIKFSPSLPDWKCSSINRLGFGVLNKVVLEFSQVFWDDTVDYFGATAEETDWRGQCFMFWNIKKTVGAPVLIALVVGKAAIDGQNMSASDHVNHALRVLRKLFGEASVPDPVASVVTNWGSDPFSRGAYSYVAVGSSGEDYDILGRPVENCLFFAGEATCKEHPDTVGGAMMSGLREAVRIIDILNTGIDYTAEVEAMEAAQRHTDSERNEVRDILKRLDAVEFSNVLCKSSLDGDHMLTKEALLRDMFNNAKTTAGRLHLAKELLNLPVESLKSFAGTKEGLSTLNLWILDSMGKDGTQLLRHCVRLLVLVSTNLLAVRLSGIGRTVKEKVCVHTSRDIRAVASQLVSVWIEVFRKEKATSGGLKLLRQTTASDSAKIKPSKELTSGKPLRSTHGGTYNRGNVQTPLSPGKDSLLNANNMKANCKPVKLETVTDSKSEVNSLHTHSVAQNPDSKVEDDNVAMSEEEAAAFAAAETARAAALAAAKAYASSEAECSTLCELPKIPSFHKFARREQYAQMDESDLRRKLSGGILGRQDCISEIDSRNCRVRNWSVDFSATCGNLDNSRMSGDNYTRQSYSNEVAHQLNIRENSGESAATDCKLTKAWVDSAGSGGVKDNSAIERWQSQAAAANSDFFHPDTYIREEEDSNTSKQLIRKYDRREEQSSASRAEENIVLVENQTRGADRIKKAVVDYVGSLLMPLYKARKIDKDGYKSIMKKSATKVMEQATDAEKAMNTSEFLDFRRKNKIRAFVDKLIEKYMAMNPVKH